MSARDGQAISGGQIDAYLRSVAAGIRRALDGNLVGVFVHGSFGMGDFIPNESDLDVLAVVHGSLSNEDRQTLITELARHELPPAVRGLDFALLSEQVEPTSHACWEMVLQLAPGPDGLEAKEKDPCDPRLPLDVAVARQYGIGIDGADATGALPPVVPAEVLAASMENVRIWVDRGVYRNPASGILNACRAWYYLENGTLTSKLKAGEWALKREPNPLVRAALVAYRDGIPMDADTAEVKGFFQDVLDRLRASHH